MDHEEFVAEYGFEPFDEDGSLREGVSVNWRWDPSNEPDLFFQEEE